LRRLVAINTLDAFILGGSTLAIPLLLVERNIDLAMIGVVFSIAPIVFSISRMLFASAADNVGLKKFFSLNAVTNLTSMVLYSISTSPILYTVARATQGVKEASLWAVNRNAAYEMSHNGNPHVAASTIVFVRALAIAAGAVFCGFLIFTTGFLGVFALLAVLSALILVPARRLDIGEQKRFTIPELLNKLDPRSISRRVWQTSLIMVPYTVASTLVTGFVLPIFLKTRSLGYWEIGMILAAYNGVGAFLLPLTLRRTPSIKSTILIMAVYVPAAILIPVVKGWLMIGVILFMAFGEWLSMIVWEFLISRAVKGCDNIATAIGFLLVPSNIATMCAYLFAGLLAERFGYIAPFWIAGVFFLLYCLAAWRSVKSREEG
jgi:predicted MFS family arabinose efflux permease